MRVLAIHPLRDFPLIDTVSAAEKAVLADWGRQSLFLAFTTLTVALLAGFVVTIIDKEDFPDYGTAVWWAIVTLATVGYGDVVPHTGWGRVVGSAVIIVGVTFIAFLTAVVTSLFVEEEQKVHRAESEDAQRAYQDETRRLLEEVSSRLATVETLLHDMQSQRR